MYCTFVKFIVIPKFKPSDLDLCIHITHSNMMKFLL